jgi:hypothetical protein
MSLKMKQKMATVNDPIDLLNTVIKGMLHIKSKTLTSTSELKMSMNLPLSGFRQRFKKSQSLSIL